MPAPPQKLLKEITMKTQSPFFARFLEHQLSERDANTIHGGRQAPSLTLKWPSDNDEADLRRRLRTQRCQHAP